MTTTRTPPRSTGGPALGGKVEARRVADVLTARILDGSYPAGLRMPSEVELGAELGCGRSTVREALAHLASLGIVESRRGSGALVKDFRRFGTPLLLAPYLMNGGFRESPLDLATELLRMRTVLALEAVRLAARYARSRSHQRESARPGATSLDEARSILATLHPTDPVKRTEAELAFFLALVRASGIWPFVWLSNSFYASLQQVHNTLAPLVGGPPKDFAASMGRLLELLEAGEEQAALAHLTAWLSRVDAELMEGLVSLLSRPQERNTA